MCNGKKKILTMVLVLVLLLNLLPASAAESYTVKPGDVLASSASTKNNKNNKKNTSEHLMTDELKAASNGETFDFCFRWNGTDFYEFIYSDGTEVLIDPTYFNTKTTAYDITDQVTTEVEDIHGCDYMILSHTHGDHGDKIRDIYNVYKDSVVVVPGSAAAEFVSWYGITPSQNVVVGAEGGGDLLKMPNLDVTSYFGKHTYLRGVNANSPTVYIKDIISEDITAYNYAKNILGSLGNEGLMNYNLVSEDGFNVLLWNGALLNDYRKYQYENLAPDIMFYQQAACNVGGDRLNPDSTDLCNFIGSVGPKLALPNHMEYFTMDNLYLIGDQMTEKTNEMGLGTDYLEPTVLQWYGVNRLANGTLETKTMNDSQVPSKRVEATN